jgi:hypothetical protein
MESAELTRLAAAYLDSHPEIIERAAKTVGRDPALRRMADRHERKGSDALRLSVNGYVSRNVATLDATAPTAGLPVQRKRCFCATLQ